MYYTRLILPHKNAFRRLTGKPSTLVRVFCYFHDTLQKVTTLTFSTYIRYTRMQALHTSPSRNNGYLTDSIITVHNPSFTTRVTLHCGTTDATQCCCVALSDTSPPIYNNQSACERMKIADAASACSATTRVGRIWQISPIHITKSVRLSDQYIHNDEASTALAVWA